LISFRDVEENLKHVVEKFTLVVYFLYSIGISWEMHSFGKGALWILCANLGIAISMCLYVFRYKNYENRIVIATFSVYLPVFLYGTCVPDCNKLLLMIITLIIIIGCFGRPQILLQSALCFFLVIIGRFVFVLDADIMILVKEPDRVRKMSQLR